MHGRDKTPMNSFGASLERRPRERPQAAFSSPNGNPAAPKPRGGRRWKRPGSGRHPDSEYEQNSRGVPGGYLLSQQLSKVSCHRVVQMSLLPTGKK